MQAISSNDGVLKPVISSYIAAPRITQSQSGSPNEYTLCVVNLENDEPVVENRATDVPTIVQPVDSGINKWINSSRLLSFSLTILSIDGVLKSVISSNIPDPRVTQSRFGSLKESALGVVNLQNLKPVVEFRAANVPTIVHPVDSGIKLVHITLCTASEGLVSTQSSNCCMIVKPKQLNFDEIKECDLDESCSPLSKKKKMDGLLGQECFPSDVAVSSVDHKSVSPFFERRLSGANALSSSSKAADTLSDNNFDERMHDETTNLGLDTDENLMGGDVEDNSTISPHNIIDATCEIMHPH
nr:hypothetical protein [Tanacetum cinerariifolium]